MAKRCALLLKLLWFAAMLLYTSAPPLWCSPRGSPFCQALFRWTAWYKVDAAVATIIIIFPLSGVSRPSAWPLHCLGTVSLLLCLLYPFVGSYFLEVSGIITGRVAAVTCGVLMLAVSRRAVLVSLDDQGYIDLVGLHRAAGWWCLATSLLHCLAFAVYYFRDDGWLELVCACLPISCHKMMRRGVNTLGFVNFMGVLAMLAGAVLGLFSLEKLRRARYGLFYAVHLATSAAFVLFAALHDFQMLILALPGLCFYMQDRLTVVKERPRDLRVQPLGASILLLSWSTSSSSKAAPGHRWVSICAEAVSKYQWHPFSVFERQGRRHVLVKGLGDWSERLNSLAAGEQPLSLKVQGPFGRPFQKQGARPRALFLIAGGVGIAPFADLLHSLRESSPWRRMSLLWAVRSNEYNAMAPVLALPELSLAVDITVFITSQDPEELETNQDFAPIVAPLGPPKSISRQRAGYLLACVPVLLSLAASLRVEQVMVQQFYRGIERTLLAFALERFAPVLAALCLMLPGGAGLLFAKCLAEEELQERLTPARAPALLKLAKPNLEEELKREAALGALDVQVCGPARMVLAVRQAARALKREGCDLALDVHDPEM